MLVYGRNVAKEIFNSDKKVEKIIIQEDFKDDMIISSSLLMKGNVTSVSSLYNF